MAQERKSQKRTSPGRKLPEKNPPVPREPEIIVDIVLESDVFYLAVKNISPRPLYLVSVRFDPPLYGQLGRQNMAELPLFQKLFFMAPGKEIRTFLDTSQAYFARQAPEQMDIQIHYRDFLGEDHRAVIHHDLEIYKNLS